jgi:hypothetical protein
LSCWDLTPKQARSSKQFPHIALPSYSDMQEKAVEACHPSSPVANLLIHSFFQSRTVLPSTPPRLPRSINSESKLVSYHRQYKRKQTTAASHSFIFLHKCLISCYLQNPLFLPSTPQTQASPREFPSPSSLSSNSEEEPGEKSQSSSQSQNQSQELVQELLVPSSVSRTGEVSKNSEEILKGILEEHSKEILLVGEDDDDEPIEDITLEEAQYVFDLSSL